MSRSPISLHRRLMGQVIDVIQHDLNRNDMRAFMGNYVRQDRREEVFARAQPSAVRGWRKAGLRWKEVGALLDAGYSAVEIDGHIRGDTVIDNDTLNFLRALS